MGPRQIIAMRIQEESDGKPRGHRNRAYNKGWDQCGNALAAVNSDAQIFVACNVTNQSNNKQQFEPMVVDLVRVNSAKRDFMFLSICSAFLR